MHVREGVDLDAVVAQVLDSLVETSGVCRAGLALTEGGGRRLRFTSSDRDVPHARAPGERASLDWCHIDAFDDVPLTSVVRTGRPVVGSLDQLEDRYAAYVQGQREAGVAAVAALPLTEGTTTWGGVLLLFDQVQRLGPHQLALLQSSAARVTAEIGAVRQVVPSESRATDACRCDKTVSACVEVDPLPVSVALARRFARRRLQEWEVDDDVLDNAVLCLSELVTNVVMHASARARIELRRDPGAVVVTVRDGGAWHTSTSSSEPDPLVVHGRGLQLVEALATAWGSESHGAGTTVWCSFSEPRRS